MPQKHNYLYDVYTISIFNSKSLHEQWMNELYKLYKWFSPYGCQIAIDIELNLYITTLIR